MRNLLLLLAGLISLVSNVPYILDVWKEKTKPNLATWSTWTLINAIAGVSALATGGANNTVLLSASYFVGAAIIWCLALVKGTRRYTLFDGICQSLAIMGIVFSLIVDSPQTATVFAVVVDMLAALPSLRHAYSYPQEETWLAFLLAGFGSALAVSLAVSYSITSLAFPVGSTAINLILASVILSRRARRQATLGWSHDSTNA